MAEIQDIKPEDPKNIDEVRQLIKKHQLGPKYKSYNQQLMLEGLENVKSRLEYNKALTEHGSAGLDVEHMGGWIHNLIRDTLGGKLNCEKQVIVWELDGKTIEFNPHNGKVDYAD
jgi:hypothetical protein